MSKYAAFGAKLQYETATPGTYADIAGVRDIGGPAFSGDTVDVTTHDSPDRFREFLKTLMDAGEVSFDLVWDPEDAAGQKHLLDQMVVATSANYRIVFNTAADKKWGFVAFVTGFEPNNPVEGEISASVKMKVTGKPTLTVA